MRRLRHWLAGGARPAEDAVMVVAPSLAELEGTGALIDALSSGAVRVSAVLLARDAGEAARISARFPGAIVCAPPPFAPARGVLAGLRVRTLLAVAPRRLPALARRLFRAALARGVPVYAMEVTGAGPQPDGSAIAAFGGMGDGTDGRSANGNTAAESSSRIFTVAQKRFSRKQEICDRTEDRADRMEGLESTGATVLLHRHSAVGGCPSGPLTASAAALLLAGAVGVERDPRLSVDRLAGHLAVRRPARLTAGFIRRIDTAEALRERLGAPRTLLCLGNGPSSAAPEVGAFAHDALFRVNCDWRGGGMLAEPDMVFVGIKRAMRQLGRVPLGVATRRKEAALIACRLFEPWHGPAVYAVAERVAAGIVPAVAGPRRPTTGAYMLAVAVALAPARLAIAGVDMFAHPAGAYAPGADPTPGGSVNAFAPSHDFETDAAFIAACLGRFRGELIVFSPALEALLRRRCRGALFALTGPGAA